MFAAQTDCPVKDDRGILRMLLIFSGTVHLHLAKDFVILSTTALISGINLA
jgi:hypothetical protein